MSNIGPTIGRNSNLPPIPNRSDECNLFYILPEQTLPEVVCNIKLPACSIYWSRNQSRKNIFFIEFKYAHEFKYVHALDKIITISGIWGRSQDFQREGA